MASKNKGAVAEIKTEVMSKIEESRKQAEREMAKAKRYVEASIKKADEYVRKNPEKASLISAGIGSALGAVIALLIGNKKGSKK